MQDDLGFSSSTLSWVVNSYLVAFGGLLLLAGRLGDLVGRRRTFLFGLVVFTAASALCGLAGGPELLVVARFVQGVGGAAASAVVLGMIVTISSSYAMSGVAAEDAGLASGLVNTTQQVGGAVGLAVLTALATTRSDCLLAIGATEAEALAGGYHLAWATGAGIVAAAAVLVIVLLPARVREPR